MSPKKNLNRKLEIQKRISKVLTIDDLVFLVSYPKSGNTWLRFLLGTLCQNEKIDWLNVNDLVPYISSCSYEQVMGLKQPRIIKSHRMYDKRYKKVIYVIRDVRDVAVSYYYWFLKRRKDFNDTFNEYLEKFVLGKLDGFGNWKNNIQSWLENKDKVEQGFMWLKYEDLKKDTFKEVKNILKFLSLHKSNEEIQQAIQWSSFENMKELEEEQQNRCKMLKSHQNILLVRKGECGGWKNILNDKQKNLMKEHFGQLLIELGYETSLNW